ncbi:hypothetical protein APY04_2591 [Hyphomicrobium sulfonivorans]|uniref:Uncharacterized protein n=1 Tax=Hyphomicrobium sulfonivorans TaxID=121290 RepID=A0A109BBZ6_HYPSL|nr:hypothetical protein APY04_2591 [Hyphomicrobium sulfonivorans]
MPGDHISHFANCAAGRSGDLAHPAGQALVGDSIFKPIFNRVQETRHLFTQNTVRSATRLPLTRS